MKFGSYFEQQMEPEWREFYLRYGEFKILLNEVRALNEELATRNASPDTSPGVHAQVSTTPPKDLVKLSFSFMETMPGKSGLKGERPLPSESAFFEALDEDVKRVGSFVESTLARLKGRVEELEVEINDVARCARASERFSDRVSARDDARGDANVSSRLSKLTKLQAGPSESESRENRVDATRRVFRLVSAGARLSRSSPPSARVFSPRTETETREGLMLPASSDSLESGSQSSDNSGTIAEAEKASNSADAAHTAARAAALRDALHDVQREFLRVEKFANLNTTACYKILKKHDKLLPATVCCRYYMQRLHNSPWVTADHSAVFVVQMSDLFEKLRPKVSKAPSAAQGNGPKGGPGAQNFVRSTRKYWVSTEDVSTVKQTLAEHLPVFLMEREKTRNVVSRDGALPSAAPSAAASGPGVAADSQMTSSVYLDNVSLGLYHNRLKKMPHSIAIRLRWYGLDPEEGPVFVERKTHRESWTGDESVKERFALPANLVVPFLHGKHTWEMEKKRLVAAHAKKNPDGKKKMSPSELEGIRVLFSEVQAAAEAKQLQPTLRTVYMRTAFQVPYDASVRCSLDTSLCMLSENPRDGPTCKALNRWFRDPEIPVHRTEVTRFPHAVLEIKLALDPGEDPPVWLDDLIRSGCLTELPKFSKFMHGCAVLFPDIAQEVPYWIDDVSLRQSLQSSASRETGAVPARSSSRRVRPEMASPSNALEERGGRAQNRDNGDEQSLTHPLLAGTSDDVVLDLMGDSRAIAGLGDANSGFFMDDVKRGSAAFRRGLSAGARFLRRKFRLGPSILHGDDQPCDRSAPHPRTVPMRIEPKTYFANERTFLSWLHTATLIGTIGAGLVSVHMGNAGHVAHGGATHPGGGSINATSTHWADASDGRVLTVIHRHEHRVAVRGEALRGENMGNSERTLGDGVLDSDATSAAIEEIVSRAVAGYFESLNQNGGVSNDAASSSSRLLLGVSGAIVPGDEGGAKYTTFGLSIALTMLSASVCLCAYATWTFVWRGRQISKRSTVPFHDPYGPVVMGSIMIATMSVFIGVTAANFQSIA